MTEKPLALFHTETSAIIRMESVHRCLVSVLFLINVRGVSCVELTPVQNEKSSLEGSDVTLSYKYSNAAGSSDYFFWYRQYPGKPPEFLISHTGTGVISLNTASRLTVTVSEGQTRMDLHVSSAAVTDSAVYYCALTPATGSGYKLTFGIGTSLTIETNNTELPSYYKLDDEETELCLATGFTHRKELETNRLFNTTEPGRISNDSDYNLVVFLSSEEDTERCNDVADGFGQCETALKPDPTVNLVSLTVLGLRLFLLKTIVFNVLMTFRLCISQ